jgi:hypothetical protein
MRINVSNLRSYEFQKLCEYWKKRGCAIKLERKFNAEKEGFDYILHIQSIEVY